MMDDFEEEIQQVSSLEETFQVKEMDPFQRWAYTMRREMQEILPKVWLGPYASAMKKNEAQLTQVGITHMIVVRGPNEAYYIRPHFPNCITYLVLDIADKQSQNIIQYFRKVCEFINNALASNGRVLVHGISGISRSATLVIAYVMTQKMCTYIEAYKYVQLRRFCIHPNESFRKQLLEFEPIIMAQMNRHLPPVDNLHTHLKRPLEEDF